MAAALNVLLYLGAITLISIALVLAPLGASRRWRPARLRTRVTVGLAILLVLLPAVTPAFPRPLLPWLFPGVARGAEVLNSPEYIDVTLLPNGQVGMVFVNDPGAGNLETRFKRYFVEYGADASLQLSTASAWYPQVATFQGKVIAAYVDNRPGYPTQNQLLFRVSTDGGSTWGAEYAPFGAETFDSTHNTPLLVTSRDGTKLYLFSCCASSLPQYRWTTDPGLASWSTPAAAGDASMNVVSNSPCGESSECSRAHNFEFTETATSGQWVYVSATSPSFENYGCGRGTQVGTLGGAWSAIVGHGTTCDLSGIHGGSRATTFVDRNGYVYYVRTVSDGTTLFYERSIDGGFTWQPRVYAYTNTLDPYTVGSPVGLYVPGYSKGEYVWYAGFGGVGAGNDQNAVRVIPIWTSPQQYVDTGTARIFGTLGGDYDFGAAYPYTFGRRDIPTGIGAYKTSAEDLAIPGRLLNFSFGRSYSSADNEISTMGPAWTNSFNWALTENGSSVQIRRGDGRRDTFTAVGNGTYTPPPNVYDALVKNQDGTFTLTLKNQTAYEFTYGILTRIHEPAGNQITFGFVAPGGNLVRSPVGGTASYSAIRIYSSSYIADYAANGVVNDGFGAGISWAENGWFPGDWWKVTWTAAQSLTRVRLWDRTNSIDYFGQGHLLFSDGSTVNWSGLPDDPGANGEAFLEVPFARKTGITWVQVVSDSGGVGNPGLAEVEAYDDQTPVPVYPHAIPHSITDTVGRTVALTYSSDLPPSAGTNLAAAKTYLKSVAADTSPVAHDDTNGTELADGNLGNATNADDASWQWHSNLGATPLDVTVDLGSAQRVGVVRSFHFHGVTANATRVTRPASIELLTSLDNAQYTSRGKTVADAAVNDTGSRWRYEFDLAGISARYVRFRITTGGQVLASSEVQVFAEGAAPVTLPLNYAQRLISIQDAIGRKVTYGYDQLGRLTRVVDKLGNATGQDPTLHTWHYTYDAQTQHILTVVDPDGRVRVTNTYGTDGRLATQKDGAGNTSNFSYGTQITMVTDPRGHLTTQLFDTRWRLTSQSDTVGGTNYALQYFYEDAGQNLTRTIDRNGNTTTYTYDSRGNVLTKLDPVVPPNQSGYLTTYTYDTTNNLRTITDALGFVTTNDYDPVTNVKLKTTQQIDTQVPQTNAITTWEYTDANNPGLPTFITSPKGNTGQTPNHAYAQTLSYDSQGNLSTRTDADGDLTRFCYDTVSRQTSMVDPDGNAACGVSSPHTWTTTYNENDWVTAVTDPLTHSTLTGYDGAGNRTTVTDRDGNVTTYAYDGAARLASVKQKPDPIGSPTLVYTTSVVRDGNGNATQVSQDHQGPNFDKTVVTDYGYDELNRLTSVTTHPGAPGPANLTTSYLLDGNGNPTQRTTGDNVQTTYTYDPMSRLSTVAATGLSTITYHYDGLSHRSDMIDGTGTSTYTYDGLGRLTQAAQPSGTLGYGYDLDSNRTTLTYPTVGSVTYGFFNSGRLQTVTDWASRVSQYTYFASGLTHTVTVPGGMTTTYTYDNAQRLATLTNTTSGGTITSDTYTLDAEGNRTAIDETMPPVVFASAKVNDDAGTAVQDHPAIALGSESPNPASYLVWDDQRDGSTNSNIYFSKRDPVTGAWSANVKVNSDTGTRNQANPAIAVDAANIAYTVWDDFRDGTSNQNIYSRKRTAAGVWDTSDTKVNDGTGNTNERNPRIAGTATGVETAVWVDLRSSQLNIYASQLNVSGCTNWCANKRVTDNTSSSVAKDFPDVAAGSDGTSYAVWQDSRNGNADIFFSSLTSGGSAWAANSKISDDPGTAAQTKARIGVDSSGNLIAAWIDARTSPSHVRVARRPSGGSWSASIDISPSPANVQSLALTVRADGFAWATWGDTRSTAQQIWGSRYDPNLGTWSTPVRLDDYGGSTAALSNPTVAFGAAEVMVAWRDNRLSANGDTQARRLQVLAGMSDHFVLAYDGLNRLKSIAGPVAEGFTLDGTSNITARTGPSQTDAYDAANRLTSDGTLSYHFNDADRLDTRGSDTFSYDPLDRMTGSTVAGSARTYAYNGDGLLQSRTGSGAMTFLWDPSTSISRLLKVGGDSLVYGLGPLYAVRADSTTLTLARDGDRNVRAEVNSAGVATAAFRYRAYGSIGQGTAALPSYLGVASQLADPSGLVYMRARWYDPSVGRFITRDAFRGAPQTPSSMNAYLYAGANPVLRSDPTGLSATTGDVSGGCVDYRCATRVDYNTTTTASAAETQMTWYLEEAAAAPVLPSDYTKLAVSVAAIPLPIVGAGAIGGGIEVTRDRYGQWYFSAGPSGGLPGAGIALTSGYIHGPADIDVHSAAEISSFITNWTRTESVGLVAGYGRTSSSSDRYSDEYGLYSPTASIGSSYGWTSNEVGRWITASTFGDISQSLP